jgi:site-specific recombinase XerD
VQDITLGTGAHVRCLGKGRKERATPLTPQTAEVLRCWLTERRGAASDPLFPTSRGTPLSRYGVSAIVERHTRAAAISCPSLATKNPTPHVLRHTAAMRLLHAGVDTTVLALWLGHEGVEPPTMYVHADLSLKEKALARIAPTGDVPGRYRPPDKLLAFLEAL